MTLKTAYAMIKGFEVARVIAALDSALIDEPLLNVLARSTACEALKQNHES